MTIASIARMYKMYEHRHVLLDLNKPLHPDITMAANLRKGTIIVLPDGWRSEPPKKRRKKGVHGVKGAVNVVLVAAHTMKIQ